VTLGLVLKISHLLFPFCVEQMEMSLLPESYCYHVTFISHINCHFYHLISGSTSHSLYSHASTFGRQNLARHNNGDTNLHKVRKVTSFALRSLIIDNAQHLHICARAHTHTHPSSNKHLCAIYG